MLMFGNKYPIVEVNVFTSFAGKEVHITGKGN